MVSGEKERNQTEHKSMLKYKATYGNILNLFTHKVLDSNIVFEK